MVTEGKGGRIGEEDFIAPKRVDLSGKSIQDLYFKLNGIPNPSHRTHTQQNPRTSGPRRG